jgi:hypothetical protein
MVLSEHFVGFVSTPVTKRSLCTTVGIQKYKASITDCILGRCIPPSHTFLRCATGTGITCISALAQEFTILVEPAQVDAPWFESLDLFLERR